MRNILQIVGIIWSVLLLFLSFVSIANASVHAPLLQGDEDLTSNPCGVNTKRYTDLASALREPKKVCLLDLSGKGLTSVPDAAFQLPNLKVLDVSNNKLKTLPRNLHNAAKKLKVLHAGCNTFSIGEQVRIRQALSKTRVDLECATRGKGAQRKKEAQKKTATALPRGSCTPTPPAILTKFLPPPPAGWEATDVAQSIIAFMIPAGFGGKVNSVQRDYSGPRDPEKGPTIASVNISDTCAFYDLYWDGLKDRGNREERQRIGEYPTRGVWMSSAGESAKTYFLSVGINRRFVLTTYGGDIGRTEAGSRAIAAQFAHLVDDKALTTLTK
jgi:hypothetical protein